tara:strand:- start:384 stop:755 length:372 start_codon:yes stop_codon:yes gene_type:complete
MIIHNERLNHKTLSSFYYFRFRFGFGFCLRSDRSIVFRLPSILVLRCFGLFFLANTLTPHSEMLLRAKQGSHQTKINLAVTAKKSSLAALPQDAVLNYLLQKPTQAKYRNRLASNRPIKPDSS